MKHAGSRRRRALDPTHSYGLSPVRRPLDSRDFVVRMPWNRRVGRKGGCMQPIGPLMWEHRTIERAVRLMDEGLVRMKRTGVLETRFLELSADFIRTYADRTHHGKEEDILFRELSKKPLSNEDLAVMDELVAEHVQGRELTRKMLAALELRDQDATAGMAIVTDALEQLCLLYPAHIDKEDKRFFHPVMRYFDRGEMDRMLLEFQEFDRQLIHERYKARLDEMRDAARAH